MFSLIGLYTQKIKIVVTNQYFNKVEFQNGVFQIMLRILHYYLIIRRCYNIL